MPLLAAAAIVGIVILYGISRFYDHEGEKLAHKNGRDTEERK